LNGYARHAGSDPEEAVQDSRNSWAARCNQPADLRVGRPESDLDLLVEMEPGRSLLDHIALIQDLEEDLGCRVDVVTEKALKERYRKKILEEVVPL